MTNPPDRTFLSTLLFGWTRQAWSLPLVFLALVGAGAGLYVLETGMTRHPRFELEAIPGFYAIFGFISFALMVLSGWVTGKLLKRDETYYDEQDGQ